ncbi:hypothetical protein BD311DRAFT_651714 [Dichomitus squalens]|uniref:F-box domain-containing protein n=1 Tax=Dichomitus squalens TaxID=114155 RepID=A0A4Q9N1C1_9APHY|nr:hypothetical protein BD311DRAFT_651714 [Dichomitus squalens]
MARNPYFQLPHLALPWEVIENVIEQSRNESQVLYNFSTTCHQLRPRSLSLLVAHVKLKSEGKVLAFCDFLRGKPYLQPLVRSLVVSPTDFAPVPLLSLLPGLGDIVLITHGYDDTRREERPTTCLNKSIPWYYKHGTRIETLHLFNLSFSTCCAFSRMLSAFTCVKDLTCMDLLIGTKEGSHPLQIQGSNQRLAERLALRVLTLDWDVEEAAVDLLLDLTRSTVERLLLTVQHSYKFVDPDAQLYSFSKATDWKQLRFLTLKLLFEPESMLAAVDFFDAFHPPHLQGVTCLLSSDLISVLYCINETEESELPFQELEQILLGFANPKISLAVDGPLHPRRQRFWTQELGQNFPTLLERNAFVVASSSSSEFRKHSAIHENAIDCLLRGLRWP